MVALACFFYIMAFLRITTGYNSIYFYPNIYSISEHVRRYMYCFDAKSCYSGWLLLFCYLLKNHYFKCTLQLLHSTFYCSSIDESLIFKWMYSWVFFYNFIKFHYINFFLCGMKLYRWKLNCVKITIPILLWLVSFINIYIYTYFPFSLYWLFWRHKMRNTSLWLLLSSSFTNCVHISLSSSLVCNRFLLQPPQTQFTSGFNFASN